MRIGGSFAVAALCAAALLAPAAHGAEEMTLVCSGQGSALKTESTYVGGYDYHRHKYESGVVTTTGRRSFSGSAYVEISGSFARIKVPRAMLPGIHDTHGGWSDIQDLFMNADEITGKVRLNGLNKPRLRIDRKTGMITIGDSFTGDCDKVDESEGPKF